MGSYGFRRTRSGQVVARFDDDDRAVLQVMLRSLAQLVAPDPTPERDPLADLVGIDPDATVPTDPVLARLLPDGYGESEPEASQEFRRFTERGLREGKVRNAERALATLDEPARERPLDPEDVAAWLGALNDLRLTIGTRLEVVDDPDEMDRRVTELGRVVLAHRDRLGGAEDGDGTDEEAPSAETRAALEELAAHQAYDWLTFLQESLVHAARGR